MQISKLVHKIIPPLDKPRAATMEEWAKWKKENKEKYPFRYWVYETLPVLFAVHVTMPLNDKWWAIKHRLIPKHQYHIVRTGLKPGYYDPVYLILHANMKLFQDFYETEAKNIDWENSSPQHAAAYKQMTDIYNWWTEKWPKRHDYTPDMVKLPDYPDHPEGMSVCEWFSNEDHRKIAKIHNDNEQAWEREEQKYLKKLIDVRPYLWY